MGEGSRNSPVALDRKRGRYLGAARSRSMEQLGLGEGLWALTLSWFLSFLLPTSRRQAMLPCRRWRLSKTSSTRNRGRSICTRIMVTVFVAHLTREDLSHFTFISTLELLRLRESRAFARQK